MTTTISDPKPLNGNITKSFHFRYMLFFGTLYSIMNFIFYNILKIQLCILKYIQIEIHYFKF